MRIVLLTTVLAAAGFAADDRRGDGLKAFQGNWTIVEMEKGKKGDQPVVAPTVIFDGNKYRIKAGDKVVEEGTFAVDQEKTPNRIKDAATAGMDKGKKWHGVYELKGDTLRALVGPAGKDPPTAIAEPQPGQRVFTLKRARPSKP